MPPVTPPPLTTVPPYPALADRAAGTYNTKAYAFGNHMSGAFNGEMSALADNVFDNAVEGAASAATATAKAAEAVAAASAATATANASAWVNGGTYALNANAISGVDFQTYRKTTASSVTSVDPSADPANWAVVVGLPTQTGNAGKLLTTTGVVPQWVAAGSLVVPAAYKAGVFTSAGQITTDLGYFNVSTTALVNNLPASTALPDDVDIVLAPAEANHKFYYNNKLVAYSGSLSPTPVRKAATGYSRISASPVYYMAHQINVSFGTIYPTYGRQTCDTYGALVVVTQWEDNGASYQVYCKTFSQSSHAYTSGNYLAVSGSGSYYSTYPPGLCVLSATRFVHARCVSNTDYSAGLYNFNGTTITSVTGALQVEPSASLYASWLTRISDTQALMVYLRANSPYIAAAVLTDTGSALTAGSVAVSQSATCSGPPSVCDIGGGKFLVVATATTGNTQLYGAVVTVSGATVTWGAWQAIGSHTALGVTNYPYYIVRPLAANKAVLAFSAANGGAINAVVVTCAGTTVSTGTAAQVIASGHNGSGMSFAAADAAGAYLVSSHANGATKTAYYFRIVADAVVNLSPLSPTIGVQYLNFGACSDPNNMPNVVHVFGHVSNISYLSATEISL